MKKGELEKSLCRKRKEDQENRRAKTLSLTTSGKKFMDTLSIERVKIIEESAQALADKVPLKILKIVSRKIFKNNEAKK